jgi:RimJ/RimL family protein N-acetyltransferase
METVEQEQEHKTSPRFASILYGKKTIGFPMLPKDLEKFVDIHMDDKDGMLASMSFSKMSKSEAMIYADMLLRTGQIVAWVFQAKDGRGLTVGYCYLIEPKDHATMIGGIMDKDFARGLDKLLRKDKYTYAEDSFRSVIAHCFKVGMHRITTEVLEVNKLSQALQKRVGFVKEGTLRKAFQGIDGAFINMNIYGLLKEEYAPWEKVEVQAR